MCGNGRLRLLCASSLAVARRRSEPMAREIGKVLKHLRRRYIKRAFSMRAVITESLARLFPSNTAMRRSSPAPSTFRLECHLALDMTTIAPFGCSLARNIVPSLLRLLLLPGTLLQLRYRSALSERRGSRCTSSFLAHYSPSAVRATITMPGAGSVRSSARSRSTTTRIAESNAPHRWLLFEAILELERKRDVELWAGTGRRRTRGRNFTSGKRQRS